MKQRRISFDVGRFLILVNKHAGMFFDYVENYESEYEFYSDIIALNLRF